MDDLLRPEFLAIPGAELGHRVIVKQKTGSTNDEAKALAEEGASHGVVVMAEEQVKGRGRLGRNWHSPAGKDLLFSVILRDLVNISAGLITLGAGVAVAEAVSELCGLPAKIKWPNDVRIKGKKLAGILAEAGGKAEVAYVVMGIGLNVNSERAELAEEIRASATSLYIETERQWPRVLIYQKVMDKLTAVSREWARGESEGLLERWLGLSEARGKRVRAETAGRAITGAVLGVRDDGALRMLDENGDEQAILAGDITILEDEETEGNPS